jgi:beta-dihydromenaquinone-9 omega-hydroxylase
MDIGHMSHSASDTRAQHLTAEPLGKFTASLVKVGVDSLGGVFSDTLIERVRRRNGAHDPVTGFNPFKAQTIANPYPEYRELLAGPPARYNPRLGIWIVPRFTDVRAGLRDHDRLSSAESQSRFRVELPMMIAKDPPEHTRLRRLVSRAFTPRALARWETMIDDVAGRLVDDMLAKPDPDGVRDMAQLLPTTLIASMFDIPAPDHAKFRLWSEALIDGSFVEVGKRTFGVVQRMARGTLAMRRYLQPLIAERRLHPGADLISLMMQSEEDDILSDDEIFWGVVMLIVAGNETTTNLLGWLMHTFAHQPEIFEALRRQPDLIPAAVEEQLRIESPVQGFYRTATTDYQLEDQTIPRQSRVLLLFGAANRDPRHFDEPDSFRLDRESLEHMSFGGGVHFCLGAHLTRMEAHRLVGHLVQRIAAIEPAGPATRLHNATMHGWSSLPLRVVPA